MAESSYKISNFLGGVNFSVSEENLQTNETQAIQNMDITDGRLKTSKGFDYYSTALISGGIKSLMKFYNNNNTVPVPYLLVANDYGVYYLNNTTWVPILTGMTNGAWDYINYQKGVTDVILFANGTSGPYQWIGSGNATPITGTVAIPRMKSLALHKERVWGAGADDNPNTIFYSDDLDYTDWSHPVDINQANEHGGFWDISTWDGSRVIGISPIFNDVVIFKSKSIHKVFGTYPKNFQLLEVYSTVGGIAEKSICHSSDRAFFLSHDGLYVYDGNTVKPLLGQKLSGIVINPSYEKNAVGIIFRNKLYMAVPENTSTINNLVIEYDLIKDNVSLRRGFEVTDFIDFQDTLLFSNVSGYIYKYNVGTTYLNTGLNQILSFYETPLTDMGAKNAVKNITVMYLMISGSGQIKIEFIMDGVTKSAKYLTLPTSTKIIKKNLNYRGRLFKIRFSNVNGSTFILSSPEFIVDSDID